MKRYIIIKDKLQNIFLANKGPIISTENGQFLTEYYTGLYLEHFQQIDIINVQDETIFIYRDMIDVTNNKLYTVPSLLDGKIKRTDIILEGPDGVGKTTIARSGAMDGILMQDRQIDDVTKMMHLNIPEYRRINTVHRFLSCNPEKELIFLVLSELELIKRVRLRGNVSNYDENTLEYLRLYRSTFEKLHNRHTNLHMIDSTDDSVGEVKKKVLKIINRGIII